MKGFKRHLLDFEIIPTGNPKTLVFVDASDYRENPERPLLEITLPGYTKYFLVNIVANRVNTLNSNTIGLTSIFNGDEIVDLPDGIYSYRYKVCPYSKAFIDKQIFRTTLIEQKIAILYEGFNTSNCCDSKDKVSLLDIAEIYSLVEGAKLIAHKDEKKANQLYQTASKLIDGLIKKIDKNCC